MRLLNWVALSFSADCAHPEKFKHVFEDQFYCTGNLADPLRPSLVNLDHSLGLP